MKRRILSNIKSLRCSGNVSGEKVLHVKKESRRIYKEYRTSAKLASIKLIGVAGLCSGAGTTQMCIMLAVFMGKVLKKKTGTDPQRKGKNRNRVYLVPPKAYVSNDIYSMYK